MKKLSDPVWRKQGISWIWDEEARNLVCAADEIWSLRALLRADAPWKGNLPSNDGNTLVVAGLDGSLDLLTPEDAETWLDYTIKKAILSFQEYYSGETALIFWLPRCEQRVEISATDTVSWKCGAPYGEHKLDFGRILWGEAREYPKEILIENKKNPVGLYHRRIS